MMSRSLPAPAGPVLRDIHLPRDPSWWPPAPGWWLLAFLLLGLAIAAAWLWRRRQHARRARARVFDELDALLARHAMDGDNAMLAAGMHQLLRRAARRYDPQAVQAHGERWRQILARVPMDAATLTSLQALEQSVYRPQPFDVPATHAAMRRWLDLALRMKHADRGSRAHA